MKTFESSHNPEMKHERIEWKFLQNPAERIMIEFGIIELIQKVNNEQLDTLIFLDKSARPLSWIFRKSWELIFPDKKPPEIKFVNPPKIMTDRNSTSESQEQKNKIKKEFEEIFGEHLQGKILLVDEKSFTGDSYKGVKNLVQHLDKYKDVKIDTFDIMQIWPSWKGNSDKLSGVEDSNDESFLSVPAPTGESRDLRKELVNLSDQIGRHFSVISKALGSIDEWTSSSDFYLEISFFLQKYGIPLEYNGLESPIIPNEVVLEKLKSNVLPLDYIIDLYSLLRSFKVELKDNNQMPSGYFNVDENEVLKEISKKIEAGLH